MRRGIYDGAQRLLYGAHKEAAARAEKSLLFQSLCVQTCLHPLAIVGVAGVAMVEVAADDEVGHALEGSGGVVE